MKKIILFSILCSLFSVSALADEVTMEATQSDDGQWTLYVNMSNPSTIYSGFQMDFVIPEGITADLSNVAKTLRTTNLTLRGAQAANGLPRVVGYSSNKRNNITGTSGRIFSFPLSVDESLPSGTYTIVAKNVRLTNTNGNETVLPNATCTITISAKPQYILAYWDDDELYFSTAMEAGTPIHPIPDPDPREGYSFCGWGDVPEVMPDHNLELHSVWCVNSYELKFIVEGETAFTSQVAYGNTLPTFEAPVIDGYVFLYWEGEQLDTMPAHDVTYTAHYARIGDVNLDGSVNTADVVAVYSYIISGDESGIERERADVNNDGFVNTADVTAIYYIITNGN